MTNALGQTVWYTYDMRFGIQNSFTDANGAATATTYDDFGRAIETRITDPENPAQEVTTKTITYDLNSVPASITETTFTGQEGIETTSVTYLDGLGRTKQTRLESEDGQFIVTNQIYDQRGNVAKQFLPVFETGIEYSVVDENALGTVMTYDALGRMTKTETPIGISEKIYDQWTETTIDPNGNKKDLIKDARGNLIQVNEYLDDVSYATKYSYNPLNQLIKITDALGNIRSMTYDLLGRKLTDEDLHVAGDTTFGVRNYEYDANGNLTKSIDAKGNIVDYIYDDMDRMVSEDFAGTTGIETAYTYDEGNYGLGRLSSVTTPDLQKPLRMMCTGKCWNR
ncbi:RHS repeat protein, partial [Candidatus Gracilibacteria bacterium]|nr:RHS repeat protein [Candidatus Gracilibacteria bacterium]